MDKSINSFNEFNCRVFDLIMAAGNNNARIEFGELCHGIAQNNDLLPENYTDPREGTGVSKFLIELCDHNGWVKSPTLARAHTWQ